MTSLLATRLAALDAAGACASFSRIRRGIEKESLRVTPTGAVSVFMSAEALNAAGSTRSG